MTASFLNISASKFSLNGLEYHKIFIPVKVSDTHLKIVSVYDVRFQLLPATKYDQIIVNGNGFTSLQDALNTLAGFLYVKSDGSGGYSGTLLSTDTNNALVLGTDGGVYLDADLFDTSGSEPPVDGTYADINELIANQNNQQLDFIYKVLDASADPTVESGTAYYFYNDTTAGTLDDYTKLTDTEVADLKAQAIINALGYTPAKESEVVKEVLDASGNSVVDGNGVAQLSPIPEGASLIHHSPITYSGGAQVFAVDFTIAQPNEVKVGNTPLGYTTQYTVSGNEVTILDPLESGAVVFISYWKNNPLNQTSFTEIDKDISSFSENFFAPDLNFEGFVDTTTTTPLSVSGNVYIAKETGVIFGIDVIKGQSIIANGTDFEIYTKNQFQIERKSTNYFNKNTVTPDFLIANSNGDLTANSDWNVSEFIKVEPNTTYYVFDFGNLLQYDIKKQPISSTFESTQTDSLNKKAITTAKNAFYIKISLTDVNLPRTQITKSNSLVPYEEYSDVLKITKLKDSTPVEFAAFNENEFVYTEGKNLFDNSRITFGFLNSSGSLQTYSSGWYTSHYIKVQPNTQYYANISVVWSEFNSNKEHLPDNFHSSIPTQQAHTYVTSADTHYLRIGFHDTRLNTLQVELGSVKTLYERYIGKTVFSLTTGDKISFNENFRKIEKKWFGKKLLTVGTSITFRDQYQPTLAQSLRLDSYTNKGVSGRVLRNMNLDTDDATPFTATFLQGFDVITIEALANDYGTDRVLGSIGDVTASNTFYGDLHKIIEFYSANAPKVKLVFISNLKLKGYGFDWNQPNNAGVTQLQYNNAMQESCAYYGIPFINMYELGGVNEFNYASFYDGADYVHPGANTGMIRMSEVISNNLEKL